MIFLNLLPVPAPLTEILCCSQLEEFAPYCIEGIHDVQLPALPRRTQARESVQGPPGFHLQCRSSRAADILSRPSAKRLKGIYQG